MTHVPTPWSKHLLVPPQRHLQAGPLTLAPTADVHMHPWHQVPAPATYISAQPSDSVCIPLQTAPLRTPRTGIPSIHQCGWHPCAHLWELFPYPGQPIIFRRDDCFFKCENNNASLQETWKNKETKYHQRNKIIHHNQPQRQGNGQIAKAFKIIF